MPRSPAESRSWMDHGTKLVAEALIALDEDGFGASSGLPGWTRKHLVAHLAANADALANLVHWASTGEMTPMYSSPGQRDADIESGSRRSAAELVEWFAASADRLGSSMDDLTATQWSARVVTAQGRTVPAHETPWLRAREVMVHAVDLATGIRYDDLPARFLAALCDDIVAKRRATATATSGPALHVESSDVDARWRVDGCGTPVLVTGTLADLAAYLSGRGAAGVTTPHDRPVPRLPAWL